MTDEPILFFDLKTQAARIKADVKARLDAILDHGAYINGPEVLELERRLAEWTGAKHACAVASGTDSLVIAMMGEGVGKGDAVFIPAFTYNATANAVLMAGGVPVFVDVGPTSCNMDVASLEGAVDAAKAAGLTPKMVVPVDLYGLPAEYPAINAVAARHGMTVLSDAAQSFGGEQGNARVGALCDMTSTSFYPSKTLGAYGDGGALFTDDAERLERWRSIRWHGTDDARKESVRVGMNGRLDSMQCAVVLAKLSVFDEERDSRRAHAAAYRARLAGRVEMQDAADGHAWGLFTVMVDRRDAVMAALKAKGVPSSIYYNKPLHRHAAFAAYAPQGGCPNAEALADRVLSLPFHPYLTATQIDRVCDALLAAA